MFIMKIKINKLKKRRNTSIYVVNLVKIICITIKKTKKQKT